MITPVFFSAADRQLESLFNPRLPPEYTFEKSLVLNVLFQQKILLPDIYFFISKGLSAHIYKYKKSLLEACIEHGVVVPAFRDPHAASFPDVLDTIRGNGDSTRAIVGVREDADMIAYRLQHSIDACRNFSPLYWQHDFAEQYDHVIEQYVMRDEPPDVMETFPHLADDLNMYWKLTKTWRINCILEAREVTHRIAGKGVRRGEIVKAVARQLGLPDGAPTRDIADLMPFAQTPLQRQALQLFFRWVTECYQINMAEQFHCTTSIPSFEQLGSLMALNLVPSHTMGPFHRLVPTINETVSYPPINALLEMSPDDLLKIRGEFGGNYLAALAAWQHNPTEGKADRVRKYLKEYSEELVKWAATKRDFSNFLLDVFHVAKSREYHQALSSILNVSKTIPLVDILVILMEEGYSNYQLHFPPMMYDAVDLKAELHIAQRKKDAERIIYKG